MGFRFVPNSNLCRLQGTARPERAKQIYRFITRLTIVAQYSEWSQFAVFYFISVI